jgi:hypothetical protein
MGHAHAHYKLGQMFEEGLGVAKDLAEAIRLYRRAAALGDGDAIDGEYDTIFCMIRTRDVKIIRAFVAEDNSCVNKKTDDGDSPLHLMKDYIERDDFDGGEGDQVVRILIAAKADVSARNDEYYSLPL